MSLIAVDAAVAEHLYNFCYQHKLIKMRAELGSLNHCAVPFLSHVTANLCWVKYIFIKRFKYS